MSKYSKSFKYDINKPCPVFFVPEILPGEDFKMITDQAAPDILPYYAISNFGRIWHVYENKFMSTSWDGGGYRIAVLRTKNGVAKTYRVHRLLMMTFKYDEYLDMVQKYPNENIVVCHVNDIKTRNYIDFPGHPDNLIWGTQAFNMEEAHRTGIKKAAYGESHGNSNITTETAHEICKLLVQGNLNHRQIAEITGTTVAHVENIKYKRTWKHVSYLYF